MNLGKISVLGSVMKWPPGVACVILFCTGILKAWYSDFGVKL